MKKCGKTDNFEKQMQQLNENIKQLSEKKSYIKWLNDFLVKN